MAIPFVAFGALVVMNLARRATPERARPHLEQRAQEAKLVERYVVGQYIHLHLLSLDPQVRQAVSAPPRPIAPEEARRLDQAWAAGRCRPGHVHRAGSPLAGRLRELGQVHPGLKLLQVIDAEGRLLASTVRGGRLWNRDTAWFHAVADASIGQRPYFVDIGRHGGAGPMLEIAYPIRDGAGGV